MLDTITSSIKAKATAVRTEMDSLVARLHNLAGVEAALFDTINLITSIFQTAAAVKSNQESLVDGIASVAEDVAQAVSPTPEQVSSLTAPVAAAGEPQPLTAPDSNASS